MTNEIISRESIPFDESEISVMVFEDNRVLLFISGKNGGISCNIHGTKSDLIRFNNIITAVLEKTEPTQSSTECL